jgi:hypothetical protein
MPEHNGQEGARYSARQDADDGGRENGSTKDVAANSQLHGEQSAAAQEENASLKVQMAQQKSTVSSLEQKLQCLSKVSMEGSCACM